MSGPEFLGQAGHPGRKDRSFRIGLNRRQEMLLNKELNDLGQRTINEVRVRKEMDIRNASPELDELQRRVKEEFTSKRHNVVIKRPPLLPPNIDLKTKLQDRRGSRELAGLYPYNPLDKDKHVKGPLKKYPYANKDKPVPLEALKNDPKITSVGVIPARKSMQIDELRVILEGTSAIPVNDRSIQEIQAANNVELEAERAEETSPVPELCLIETDRTAKTAILGQIGTTRQAPLTERPPRASSISSLSTVKRIASAGSTMRGGSKLTESKLNLHDKMSMLDKDRLREDGDRSEGSASTIRSAKELLEEAEAITGVAKKRKTVRKTKRTTKTDSTKKKKIDDKASEDTEVSDVSRGRSVDEIIASLQKQQENQDESLSESDRKIQEIMGRVLERTKAVLGETDPVPTDEMEKITELDENASPREPAEDASEMGALERRSVTIVVEPMMDDYAGSETATYEYPTSEEVTSTKMAEARKALATIQSELEEEEAEERLNMQTEVINTAQNVEEEEAMDYEKALYVMTVPVEVTNEDMVGIKGAPKPVHAVPPVHEQSVSSLSTRQPREARPKSAVEPVQVRSRDFRSVHQYCTYGGEHQLPKEYRSIMGMYHTPSKLAPGLSSVRDRFGPRRDKDLAPVPSTDGSCTPNDTALADRLVRAASRVMQEASKLEPDEKDVEDWKARSDKAMSELEVRGEKMKLKDNDGSRFCLNPAPPKLNIAPGYVKFQSFPEYNGAIDPEYDQATLEADEDDASGSDEGDEVAYDSWTASFPRPQSSTRRYKSSEDLTIYQRAKHKRLLESGTAREDPFTRHAETPSMTSSSEPRMSTGELRQLYGSSLAWDATLIPTFVRRRTNSAPSAYDESDSLLIPEDFSSAMEELDKQHESLKRHWKQGEQQETPEVIAVTGESEMVNEILAEMPEGQKKKYEQSIYEKIKLRAEKKTPAELALEAGRSYVLLPKKKKVPTATLR